MMGKSSWFFEQNETDCLGICNVILIHNHGVGKICLLESTMVLMVLKCKASFTNDVIRVFFLNYVFFGNDVLETSGES